MGSSIVIRLAKLSGLPSCGVADSKINVSERVARRSARRERWLRMGLDGAEGLEIDVHFADFDDSDGRHWSQRGIARLARTMQERGRITKARKAWVKAVADVAEDCFEVQRKVLESHEARVKAAMDRARSKATEGSIRAAPPSAESKPPGARSVQPASCPSGWPGSEASSGSPAAPGDGETACNPRAADSLPVSTESHGAGG